MMPLFSLSWTLLAVGAVLLLAAIRGGKRTRSDWHVVTIPADQRVRVDSNDRYAWDHQSLPLSRSVLVRVEQGSRSLTVAAIDIAAEDFEERIGNAQAEAEERAMTLNALVTG